MLRPPPEPVGHNHANGDCVFICPLPGCGDTSGHLQVSEGRGIYHCFRCGSGGRTSYLRRITGIAFPFNPGAHFYRGQDRVVLDEVLAAAFGSHARLVEGATITEPVDYGSLGLPGTGGLDPGTITGAAAEASGLGRASFLLPLARLGPEWWTRPALTGRLPAWPWDAAVLAMRYLFLERGFSYIEALTWRLCVPTDPELVRKGLRISRYGRIVFPSWDLTTGGLATYQARSLRNARPRYLAPAKPPAAPSLLLSPRAYVAARCDLLEEAVLVEGPFDAMAVDRAEAPSIALCGKTLSGDGLAMLLAKGLRRATVMLDCSEYEAAARLAGQLTSEGVSVLVAEVPPFRKDPGEMPVSEVQAALKSARAPALRGVLASISPLYRA